MVTGGASAWRGLWGRRNAANCSEVGFPSAFGAHDCFATGGILGGEVSVASFGHQDGGNSRRERERKRNKENERESVRLVVCPFCHRGCIPPGFLSGSCGFAPRVKCGWT